MLLNTNVIFLSAVAFITLLKPTSAAAVDYKAASADLALERRQNGQLGWNNVLQGHTFNNFELFNDGHGNAQYWGGRGWTTLNPSIYAGRFRLNDLPTFPVIPSGVQPFLTRNGVNVYRRGGWHNRPYFVSRVGSLNRFGYFPANYALGGFQGLSQAKFNW